MHPVSFFRGVLFGAFVMYLFAPRSGAETRRMLTQTSDNLKNTLGDIAGSITGETTGQSIITTDEALPVTSSNTYKPMTYQGQL